MTIKAIGNSNLRTDYVPSRLGLLDELTIDLVCSV
jgi:hypothetical protein